MLNNIIDCSSELITNLNSDNFIHSICNMNSTKMNKPNKTKSSPPQILKDHHRPKT